LPDGQKLEAVCDYCYVLNGASERQIYSLPDQIMDNDTVPSWAGITGWRHFYSFGAHQQPTA